MQVVLSLEPWAFVAVAAAALDSMDRPNPSVQTCGLIVLFRAISATYSEHIVSSTPWLLGKLIERMPVFESSLARYLCSRCVHLLLAGALEARRLGALASGGGVENLRIDTLSFVLHSGHHYIFEMSREMKLSNKPQEFYYSLLLCFEPFVQFFPATVLLSQLNAILEAFSAIFGNVAASVMSGNLISTLVLQQEVLLFGLLIRRCTEGVRLEYIRASVEILRIKFVVERKILLLHDEEDIYKADDCLGDDDDDLHSSFAQFQLLNEILSEISDITQVFRTLNEEKWKIICDSI